MSFLNIHPDNVKSADFQSTQVGAFSQSVFWDGIFTAYSLINAPLFLLLKASLNIKDKFSITSVSI